MSSKKKVRETSQNYKYTSRVGVKAEVMEIESAVTLKKGGIKMRDVPMWRKGKKIMWVPRLDIYCPESEIGARLIKGKCGKRRGAAWAHEQSERRWDETIDRQKWIGLWRWCWEWVQGQSAIVKVDVCVCWSGMVGEIKKKEIKERGPRSKWVNLTKGHVARQTRV